VRLFDRKNVFLVFFFFVFFIFIFFLIILLYLLLLWVFFFHSIPILRQLLNNLININPNLDQFLQIPIEMFFQLQLLKKHFLIDLIIILQIKYHILLLLFIDLSLSFNYLLPNHLPILLQIPTQHLYILPSTITHNPMSILINLPY